jgi:hypothetical protein
MRTSTVCLPIRLALAGVLTLCACSLDLNGDDDEGAEEPSADDDDDDGDDDDDDDGTTGEDDDDDDDGDPSGTVGGDGMTDLGWHEDIAPIVVGHCGGCHNDGGPAPFSVMSYESASGWALPMAVAVQSRTMPPFFAENTDDCQVRFPWLDDPRLSEEQIGMIVDWADGGAPEGDPDEAAPLPDMPQIDIQDPDSTVVIPSDVTIQGDEDRFICFSMDPELTSDVWMSELQLVPGNERIVHHALVYVDATGESAEVAGEDGTYDCFGGAGLAGVATLVGAWTPGAVPFRAPDDAAVLLPAGSRLVANIHYHPSPEGAEVDDSTSIQMKWHEGGTPAYRAELKLEGNVTAPQEGGLGLQPGPNDGDAPQFYIPANVDDHSETMRVQLGASYSDAHLWLVATHMHYVGVGQRITVERSGGDPANECLIETPRWDFAWQRLYAYDVPLSQAPTLDSGDVITLACEYDNTTDNPHVVQMLQEYGFSDPIEVGLGEHTLDEMCLSILGIATPL